MASVRLNEITKKYEGNNNYTIHPTSFEVVDKEFMVMVGPSGCGKTTTLRMVAGLEEVTTGDIYIGERRVNDLHPKDRDIAMVFQNYALYPHMTVYQNMAFGLLMRKTDPKLIDGKVREAARLLDLDTYLEKLPKQLSGGQRQRVALGRAIVRNPQVFLMDEPLSNLDAKLRVTMRSEIRKLQKRLEATVMYVTHDQTEAMTMGDRIAIFHGGIVQQVGSPTEVYLSPNNKFVAGFIGSPSMNFQPARLAKGDGGALEAQSHSGVFRYKVPARLARAAAAHAGKDVIVGIRPENLAPVAYARFTADPGLGLDAGIDIVEMMGAESYVHMSAGGDRIVARFEARIAAKSGDAVKLALDPDHFHLFDAETEKRIS